MYVLSNTESQTIAPGGTATFNVVILSGGCGMSHRANSGIINIRKCGAYKVTFSGNVSGTAAGPVQLAVALDGEALAETTMISTVTTAGDLENVSSTTAVRVCCGCCVQLTVKNTGASDVILGANPSFVVTEVPSCTM